MKSALALGIALVTMILPLIAAAQAPPPSTSDLELQRKQRRAVVLPKPTADQVRSDADRAVSEYAANVSPGKVVRETSPVRPSARPDLDYDVKTGIQSQGISDALRGR